MTLITTVVIRKEKRKFRYVLGRSLETTGKTKNTIKLERFYLYVHYACGDDS